MKRLFSPHLQAVLALGVVCQIAQIVFLREFLNVFHGSELSFGIILAAWMIWVGIGSRTGAIFAEKAERPKSFLIISAAAVSFVLPASIFLIRVLRAFFPVQPGAFLSIQDMAVSCFILTAPAGLLFGAQFVFLSRLLREEDKVLDTSGAEKTYMGEAVGNTIGGLLFTFFLVRYLNSFQVSVLASFLMIASILRITLIRNEGTKKRTSIARPSLFWLLLLPAFSFPFLGFIDTKAYGLQWRFFSPEHDLVEIRQSKYGAVFSAKREDQYSFFQSGHLVFSTAGRETTFSGLEEQEGVVFAHFSMVQHEDPKRVLLIGGGLRGTLREILLHPVDRVDYIELDPVLTQTALSYVPEHTALTLKDPRVRMFHTDGRLFVKTSDEAYDMIIIDIPDPATAVLNRYYTKEFFREAEARLASGGVFVIGVQSTPDLRGSAVANRNATIYHTLKEVFFHVTPLGRRFLFFFASNEAGGVSHDASVLQARYLDRAIVTEGFSSAHLAVLLEEPSVRRVNWIIRNHGRDRNSHVLPPSAGPLFPASIQEQQEEEDLLPPVQARFFLNSDFKPIGYYYTLLFWSAISRGEQQEALKWIVRVKPWWIAFLAMAVLITAVYKRSSGIIRKRIPDMRFAVSCAVFTTGFSTMALLMALLFAFQSIYGFVYEMVGLITAVFMAGLSCGTFMAHRFVPDKSSIRVLAAFQCIIALLAGLIALSLLPLGGIKSPAGVFIIISAMTFVAGLLNGVDFPLTAACTFAINGRAEKSTGLVYGVELFGACTGALAAGVVIAPVLGLSAVCFIAAVGNGVAFLVLLITGKSRGGKI